MSREITKALKKIKTAGYGSETRIPIHFLMSIFDERNVSNLIARVALGQELYELIRTSTKDQRVIDARRGYDRLVHPLDYIRDRLEDLDKVYNVELPYQTATVTFRIIK